ncbi:MAG: hypothetical protein M3R50_06535 [Bacteroidota bacterium]|nr:hypothetical protein [Bacteroidota bacterium]
MIIFICFLGKLMTGAAISIQSIHNEYLMFTINDNYPDNDAGYYDVLFSIDKPIAENATFKIDEFSH